MNPADVLLSREYPSLSPLPLGDEDVLSAAPGPAPLGGPGGAPGGALSADPQPAALMDANDMPPERIAQILVAVNTSLGIDLGDLDYAQFIVLEGQEEDDSRRSRDGKREYTHIQLVCEACGHIIIAVAKAVNQAITEAGDDAEARSTLPKRKRGGILGFKELAAKAKLSPWHFHRVFRSITDVTPKAYGEACWDYLLRTYGFSVEPRSPTLGEKIPATISAPSTRGGPGPGRIGKSTSRSRSRSRPRHPSQTQAQLSALTGTDEVRRRSRSAARSSSFSSRAFIPDFTPDFSPTDLGLQTPAMVPPTSARSRRDSAPQMLQQPPNLAAMSLTPLSQMATPLNVSISPISHTPQLSHGGLTHPPHGPGGQGHSSSPAQGHGQNQLMPPGTVPGTVSGGGVNDYLPEIPNMYENLGYPESYHDTFVPDGPLLDPVLPAPGLDSTIESTPSTGVESGLDEAKPFDMPEFNTLSLSRADYGWEREDPSLAPYVREQELDSQLFADQYPEPTPEFDDLKLLDAIEEPIIFKSED